MHAKEIEFKITEGKDVIDRHTAECNLCYTFQGKIKCAELARLCAALSALHYQLLDASEWTE